MIGSVRRHGASIVAALLLSVFATSIASAQKVRLAVLGFDNNSGWHYWGQNLGYAATDELVTQLVETGRFSVIERERVDAILGEQDFGQSFRVNPATAAQMGEVLGVQLVIIGSITQFTIDTKRVGIGGVGGSYTEAKAGLDLRLVNTTTAEIMSVAEGKGKKRLGSLSVDNIHLSQTYDRGLALEALRPAVEDAVEEILKRYDQFANLAPVATMASIVGVRAENVYIDRGENFSITVGQRFDVYRIVDVIRDSHGNVLDEVKERVGVIEVTRVLSQSAICVVVEGDAAEGDTARGQST